MNTILLAEDDTVSRAFLSECISTLGYRIETVADGDAAFAAASRTCFDLLVLDIELPLRRGPEVLAALRSDRTAASQAVPALALTADHDPVVMGELLRDGFIVVAHKPITLESLAGVLATALAASGSATPLPCWDDVQALRVSGGQESIVTTLRGLLRQELPRQRSTIISALAAGDTPVVAAELHRLRASCGFCGAVSLAVAVDRLHTALRDGTQRELARIEFLRAVDQLLDVPPD